MTAFALFSAALTAGIYLAIAGAERSRQIDAHIARFLADIDGDRR